MSQRSLYLIYAIVLMILGLTGYFLTHAKSALLSGLISGGLILILGYLIDKQAAVLQIARVFNFLFLGAFTWRFTIAMNALSAGDEAKLVPCVLLSLMALASVATLATSLLTKFDAWDA